MNVSPSTSIVKLIDIANFLRGAGYDRFTDEDPMFFIHQVIDLIEIGDELRQDLADNSADHNPTPACDNWDKLMAEIEDISAGSATKTETPNNAPAAAMALSDYDILAVNDHQALAKDIGFERFINPGSRQAGFEPTDDDYAMVAIEHHEQVADFNFDPSDEDYYHRIVLPSKAILKTLSWHHTEVEDLVYIYISDYNFAPNSEYWLDVYGMHYGEPHWDDDRYEQD